MDFKRIGIPVWLMIIAGCLIVLALFSFWYYELDEHSIKTLELVGGVVSGIVVFLITYITAIGPALQLDRFKRMGIVDVLNDRHDKEYYKDLVIGARSTVRVMGASCTRFVEDFLDLDADDKVLVDALNKYGRLSVQLLVPVEKFLAPEAKINFAPLYM